MNKRQRKKRLKKLIAQAMRTGIPDMLVKLMLPNVSVVRKDACPAMGEVYYLDLTNK